MCNTQFLPYLLKMMDNRDRYTVPQALKIILQQEKYSDMKDSDT